MTKTILDKETFESLGRHDPFRCQLCGTEIHEKEGVWDGFVEEVYCKFAPKKRKKTMVIRIHISCLELESAH